MARPKKSRYVCNEPAYDSFSPNGISKEALQEKMVVMSVDEYEVFRLLDFEQITQQECCICICTDAKWIVFRNCID